MQEFLLAVIAFLLLILIGSQRPALRPTSGVE
jgi:hypothetical protein